MDAEGFTLKPDRTGCRHSYMEGSFCTIGGMSAAKCFTCDRLIAWTIETGTPTTRLTWIVEPASGVTAAWNLYLSVSRCRAVLKSENFEYAVRLLYLIRIRAQAPC